MTAQRSGAASQSHASRHRQRDGRAMGETVKKKPSLLEVAKSVPLNPSRMELALSEDAFSLAMAYCRNEVQLRQVGAALNTESASANHWIGRVLVAAVRTGRLIVAPNGNKK